MGHSVIVMMNHSHGSANSKGGSIRMGIAYVVRSRERQCNAERHRARLKSLRWWHFREHLTEWYTLQQENVHCEVSFPDDNPRSDTCVAYAVFSHEGVVKTLRTFTNPSYHWIYLNITRKDYKAAVEFCEKQIGKPYDHTATGWRLVLWPPVADGRSWWCASFVHAVLQKVGLLLHYQINTLDVDDIIKSIRRSTRVITVGMSPADLGIASIASEATFFGLPVGAPGHFSGHVGISQPLRC